MADPGLRRRDARTALRTTLRTALLLVVAIGIALVLAEGLVRLAGHNPAPALFTVTASEFAAIPGTFAPGQRVVERPGTAFAHLVTIDSLGYRGRDLPRAKPAGELRVLHAGDSFTWGHNVDDDETTPARLEMRLAGLCGAARVVNAGLSGSTIAGQDEIIARGLVLDPDVVVLMYHENDIDELIHSRIWEQLAENRAVKSRFPISVAYPLLRRTALWDLALNVRRARRPQVGQSAARRATTSSTPDQVRAAIDEYRRRLEAVRRRLAAREVPLIFVMYPHPESVRAGRGGRDYDQIAAVADSLGVARLDLLPVLRESGVPVDAAFLVPRDYHPSPLGHEVAAAAIAARIRDLIGPPRCSSRPDR